VTSTTSLPPRVPQTATVVNDSSHRATGLATRSASVDSITSNRAPVTTSTTPIPRGGITSGTPQISATTTATPSSSSSSSSQRSQLLAATSTAAEALMNVGDEKRGGASNVTSGNKNGINSGSSSSSSSSSSSGSSNSGSSGSTSSLPAPNRPPPLAPTMSDGSPIRSKRERLERKLEEKRNGQNRVIECMMMIGPKLDASTIASKGGSWMESPHILMKYPAERELDAIDVSLFAFPHDIKVERLETTQSMSSVHLAVLSGSRQVPF
jgi:hypothetical protein